MKSFVLIALIVLCIVLFATWILCIIWTMTRFKPFKRFCHDFMGWHIPEEIESFDGLSFHSKCKFCGKNIMQDSQGNWFTFD